jgi:hypothetical protein
MEACSGRRQLVTRPTARAHTPALGDTWRYLPVGQAAARYMVWHSTRMSMRMSIIKITQGEACAQGQAAGRGESGHVTSIPTALNNFEIAALHHPAVGCRSAQASTHASTSTRKVE